MGQPRHMFVQALDDLFVPYTAARQSAAAGPLPGRDAITAIVRASRTYEELASWVDAQLQPLLIGRHAATAAAACSGACRAGTCGLCRRYLTPGVRSRAQRQPGLLLAPLQGRGGHDLLRLPDAHRIEKAKELLASADLRLSDISALVGYDDPKYFGQIFRKVAGMSPLDYQRSHQHEQSWVGGRGGGLGRSPPPPFQSDWKAKTVFQKPYLKGTGSQPEYNAASIAHTR